MKDLSYSDKLLYESTSPSRQFRLYNDERKGDRGKNFYKMAKRYLRSRVGDKWGDVYSDIKKKFRGNNRIIDYFNYLIDHHVYEGRDGNFYCSPHDFHCEFFVYEDVLRYQDRIRYKLREKPNLNVIDSNSPYFQYQKIDGIWYLCELKEILLAGRTIDGKWIKVKQLNTKEIEHILKREQE
jgi:hypothetical protein